MRFLLASLLFVFAQGAFSANYHSVCTTIINRNYTAAWLVTPACKHIKNEYALSCISNIARKGYAPFTASMIRACGNISNPYALGCQASLAAKGYPMPPNMINACSTVDNPYGLSAVRSFTGRNWTIIDSMIVAAGSAASAEEAFCVNDLATRYNSLTWNPSGFIRTQCGIED